MGIDHVGSDHVSLETEGSGEGSVAEQTPEPVPGVDRPSVKLQGRQAAVRLTTGGAHGTHSNSY